MPGIIDLRQPGKADRNRQLSGMMLNQLLQKRLMDAEEKRTVAREDRTFTRQKALADRELQNKLAGNYIEVTDKDEGAIPIQFDGGIKYYKEIPKMSNPPSKIQEYLFAKAQGDKRGPEEFFGFNKNPSTTDSPLPQGYAKVGNNLYKNESGELVPVGNGSKTYAPQFKPWVNKDGTDAGIVDENDRSEVQNALNKGLRQKTAGEIAAEEEAGKGNVKDSIKLAETLYTNAENAKNVEMTYSTMKDLLKVAQPDKLANAGMQLQGLGNALGLNVDISKLGAREAVSALGNQSALQARVAMGSNLLPGSFSDADRNFIVNMAPGLTKSYGGNALLIGIRTGLARKEQEQANLWLEYQDKSGNKASRTGFMRYLKENYKPKSVFEYNDLFDIPNNLKFIGFSKKTGLPLYEDPKNKKILYEKEITNADSK